MDLENALSQPPVEDADMDAKPPNTKKKRTLIIGGVIVSLILLILISVLLVGIVQTNKDLRIILLEHIHSTSSAGSSDGKNANNPVSTSIKQPVSASTIWTQAAIKGVMIGGCVVVLLTIIALVMYMLLRPTPAPLPAPAATPASSDAIISEEERAANAPTTFLGKVYAWCQDIFPARVDFALALFLGLALAVVLSSLYPLPSTLLAPSPLIRIVGAVGIVILGGLFLPLQYVVITTIICLSFLIARWATWSSGVDPGAGAGGAPGEKVPHPPSKLAHLVNLLVIVVLAVYTVFTLSRLASQNAWEHHLVAPLLAGCTMAALAIIFIRRPLPGYGLEWVFLGVGIVGALFYSWMLNTYVIVELVVVVGTWFFCYATSTSKQLI